MSQPEKDSHFFDLLLAGLLEEMEEVGKMSESHSFLGVPSPNPLMSCRQAWFLGSSG